MKSNKIYGGIYTSDPDQHAQDFMIDAVQLQLDSILAPYYCWETLAHTYMLTQQNILSPAIAVRVLTALLEIHNPARAGQLFLDPHIGDIHENVEALMQQKIGVDAGWFHIARSRNDQVCCDQKMATRAAFLQVATLLSELGEVLAHQAHRHHATVMPGYTHSRPAMPSTFGMWWQSYLVQLLDVQQMFKAAYEVCDVCPLGAGASYGVNWPIDPQLTAAFLGFGQPFSNALAAVNNRGIHELYWLNPIVTALTIVSRMMEDVITWSSPQYGFITLPATYTTGSSIMPQKMNPDIAEKIRAKVGMVIGWYVQVATTLKGTPSGYNRDSADTKQAILTVWREFKQTLEILIPLLKGILACPEAMQRELIPTLATKVADQVVSTHRVPFRQAHQIVEVALKNAQFDVTQITPAILAAAHLEIVGETVEYKQKWLNDVLDVTKALSLTTYVGSPNPQRMLNVNSKLKRQNRQFLKWVYTQQHHLEASHTELLRHITQYLEVHNEHA